MNKKGNSGYGKGANDRSSFKKEGSRKTEDSRKPFGRKDGDKKPFAKRDEKVGKTFASGEKKFPERKRFDNDNKQNREERPFASKRKEGFEDFKPERKKHGGDKFADRKNIGAARKPQDGKPFKKDYTSRDEAQKPSRRFANDDEKRPYKTANDGDKRKSYKPKEEQEKKRYKASEEGGKPYGERAMEQPPKKAFAAKQDRTASEGERRKPKPKSFADKAFAKEKPDKKRRIDPAALEPETFDDKVYGGSAEDEPKKTFRPGRTSREAKPPSQSRQMEEVEVTSAMTLNKYIAHSGECSRRDAAAFVKEGKVRVNGELITDPGYRINPGDQITLSGKKLTPQKGLVYILLNKPKGFITTTEDDRERKTVMDLVENAGVDRLFPVGRLDRNTTGLLLMTNDGTLAHKLSHPSYNIRKVYQVTLDKNLTNADYQKIVKGVELEDGKATVDEIAYLEHRNEVGLEIHSGRNRIVRRIFESLGYEVEKLDRVMYAGLTKKNLPRSKWRFLNEKEIILLKHFKN